MDDTNHTTLHKALEQGFNRALAPYEIQCKATAKSYYVVSDKTGEITLSQPLVIVECDGEIVLQEPVECPKIPEGYLGVTFSKPTEREDGTALADNEIAGFEIKTIDTDGLISTVGEQVFLEK